MIYRLAGFENAEANFNQLAASIHQPITAGSNAEGRGPLCAEVAYKLETQWWIADPANVKLLAAKHFFAEGHSNALILAEKWWRSSRGADHADLRINTTPEGDGFLVRLLIFWAPVKSTQIQK